MGFGPYVPRHSDHAVAVQQGEGAHVSLPEYVDDLAPIQNEDGTFIFMAGYSVAGSEDSV